ncbi:MAG: response regulator [Bacteroidales bacterium]
MTKTKNNPPLEDYSILIIDDSAIIRERLKELLLDYGFSGSVLEASEIGSAVDQFGKNKPGIVITDIHLHRENGLTVIKRFRESNPGVLIIVMTNYPYDLYRRKSLEEGADFFFSKSDIIEAVNICRERGKCFGKGEIA